MSDGGATAGELAGGTRKRAVHSHAVCQVLEDEIISGALMPGTKLDEVRLAERFAVSRTPIREAFQQLIARSLVVRQPYRGVVVAEISQDRLDQMFEAMTELEAICGRLAAQRMSMRELAEVSELHAALQQAAVAPDLSGYEQLNRDFHEQIYRGTHNEDLVEMALAMRLRLAPFRRSQFKMHDRIRQSNDEHEKIVMAVQDRDTDGAERAMRRHLLSAAKASSLYFGARSKAAAE